MKRIEENQRYSDEKKDLSLFYCPRSLRSVKGVNPSGGVFIMIKSDAVTLIRHIRNQKYKPSEWEQSFMQSIENSPFQKLSYKQTRALEIIYSKSVGGGQFQGRQRIG